MKVVCHFCFVLLIISFGFLGCTVKRSFEPIKPSDFLSGVNFNNEQSDSPFKLCWTHSDFNASNYTKVIIPPVNTSYLDNGSWYKSAEALIRSQESYRSKVDDIAIYLRENLIEDFQLSENNRFKVVETPDADALVVEIAITEAIFQKPLLYTAAYAAPLPGSSYLFDGLTSPQVTFEVRVRRACDGEIIAAWADRRIPPIKPLDFNKFTVSSSVKEVIERWNNLVVEAMNFPEHQADDYATFSLKPW